MKRIAWLSVDPVLAKVDFYPNFIAENIEKQYTTYIENNNINNEDNSRCILGADFYNATIYFHHIGHFYQTTPGYSMGRHGYKQPGFRTVKRIIVPDDNLIFIYIKKIFNEYRIVNNRFDAEIILNEIVSDSYIVSSNTNEDIITIWKPSDLDCTYNCDLNKNVIIWQWCFGVSEKQGDLFHLGKYWWIPYLYEQNNQIENAYQNKETETIITLPYDSSERIITLNNDTVFGVQKDIINNKSRLIRRVILTVNELIELIYNSSKILDVSDLTKYIDEKIIPQDFYCCISQDIMVDPVKTIDGFTYDRASIEKWFERSYNSPLTGLKLSSQLLTPNNELRQQINEFKDKTNFNFYKI